MRALLFLVALVVGSIALMLQGDFGAAGIGLLVIGMVVLVVKAPFAGMPPAERRTARLTATALVLAGWFLAGVLVWDWKGASYVVAGIVAVIALVKAGTLPEEPVEPRADTG